MCRRMEYLLYNRIAEHLARIVSVLLSYNTSCKFTASFETNSQYFSRDIIVCGKKTNSAAYRISEAVLHVS